LSDLASELAGRDRPAEFSKGRSDKAACLRTVDFGELSRAEVGREGRNSLYIPPP
jgi:hypothetical protein